MSKAKWFIVGFSVLLIMIITIGLIFGATAAKTVTVIAERAENTVAGNGIVTMQLRFINSEQDGYALYSAEEGKLIKKYTPIASVYSGEINDEMIEQLKLLNDKMTFEKNAETYKDEVFNDIGSINKEINKSFSKIMNDTSSGDYSEVYEMKSRIVAYHEKALEMSGETPVHKEAADGSGRIKELEAQLNLTKQVYTSPMDGMFSPRIKNFDKLLTPEKALALSPSEFENIMKTPVTENENVEAGEPFAKIINNFEWYMVSSLNEEDISGLEEGSVVEIRVTSLTDISVDGKVVYISESENGKKVIVVKSTKFIEGIYSADKVSFEIVKKSYKGLRIPVSAIIKREDKEGVLAIKDGVYRFVEINVIFRDKSYVIIEDKSSEFASVNSGIMLYDVVVLNPENVKEGSIAGGV